MAKIFCRPIQPTFQVGLFLKGLNGIWEIIIGIGLLIFNPSTINKVVIVFTRPELSEDPSDLIANLLLGLADNLSINAQIFLSIYLLIHGVVKLALIIALLKKKLWAYPLALAVFILFAVYQIYLMLGAYSIGLLMLTCLDVLIVILTWLEYQKLKQT